LRRARPLDRHDTSTRRFGKRSANSSAIIREFYSLIVRNGREFLSGLPIKMTDDSWTTSIAAGSSRSMKWRYAPYREIIMNAVQIPVSTDSGDKGTRKWSLRSCERLETRLAYFSSDV